MALFLLISLYTNWDLLNIKETIFTSEPNSPIEKLVHFPGTISPFPSFLLWSSDSGLVSLVLSHPNLFIFWFLLASSTICTLLTQQSSHVATSPDPLSIQNSNKSLPSSPESCASAPDFTILPSLFTPSILECFIDNGNFEKSFKVVSTLKKTEFKVFLAQHRLDGFNYIIKSEVFEGDLLERKTELSILNRVNMYKSLNVSGIARYVTCWVEVKTGQVVLFVQMEKIEGVSLEDYVKTPIAAKEVLRILRKTAKVLKALHSRGMVHGNVSMENIFVDGFSKVLIGEFQFNEDKLTDLQGFCKVRDQLLRSVDPQESKLAEELVRTDKLLRELVI